MSAHYGFKIISFTASGQSEGTVKGFEFEVGRNISSDFAIMANGVSRKHLIVSYKDNQIYIKDLGSTNGTYLKGERIEPLTEILYTPGDRVSLGQAGCFIKISSCEQELNTNAGPNIAFDKSNVSGEHKKFEDTDSKKSVDETGIFTKLFSADEKDKSKASKYMKNAEILVKKRIKEAEGSIKDGIEKARGRAKGIVQKAKVEASTILEEAQVEKSKLIEEGQAEASNFINAINQQKSDTEAELESIQKQISDADQIKKDIDVEMHEYTSKKGIIQTDFEGLELRYKNLDLAFNEKNDKYEKELELLRVELKEKETRLSAIKEEKESLLKNHTQKVDESQKNFDVLNEKHKKYSQEITSFKSEKISLEENISKLKKDKDEALRLKESTEKDFDQIKEKADRIISDAEKEAILKKEELAKDFALKQDKFEIEKNEFFDSIKEKEMELAKLEETKLEEIEIDKQEILKAAKDEAESITATAKSELVVVKEDLDRLQSEIDLKSRDFNDEREKIVDTANVEAKALIEAALLEKKTLLDDIKFQQERVLKESKQKTDSADKYHTETIGKANDYWSEQKSKADTYNKEKLQDGDSYYLEKKDSADKYFNNIKSETDDKIKEYKDGSYADLEKEIAEFKVSETLKVEKEVSEQKKLFNNYKKELSNSWSQLISDSFYNSCVNDLGINVTNSLAFKDKMKDTITSIVLDKNPDEENKVRGIMNFDPEKKDRVKKYWKRTAMTIGICAVALYFAPYVLKGVKKQAVTVAENFEADNVEKIKSIEEKRKIERTFVPEKVDEFFDNYTERVVYTEGYVENELDSSYREEWFLNLDTFFVEELILSDEAIVTFISGETNLIKKLAEIGDEINPKFLDEGLSRMKTIEDEFVSEVRKIVKSKSKYNRFVKFKKEYYLKNFPFGSERELSSE